MSRFVSRVQLMAAAFVGIAALSVSGLVTRAQSSPEASTARPLSTAFFDPGNFSEPSARRARAAGATFVRLVLWWSTVAPSGETRSRRVQGVQPERPALPVGCFRHRGSHRGRGRAHADRRRPRRTWLGTREDVSRSERNEVLSEIERARRLCDGRRTTVPRWLSWTATRSLLAGLERAEPQHRVDAAGENGEPVSADTYRAMVNAFSRAVHAVHATTSSSQAHSHHSAATPTTRAAARLRVRNGYIRWSSCAGSSACPLERGRGLRARQKVEFDVWAHHPVHVRWANAQGVPSRRRVAR